MVLCNCLPCTLRCYWNGEECDRRNWNEEYTDYGLCYTFNGNASNAFYTDKPGNLKL